MKVKILFFAVIISLFFTSSCGKKSEIVHGELAQALCGSVPFSERLTQLDDSAAQRLLYLNPNDYSELTMLVGTRATCDQIIIVKTASEKTVKEKLSNYLANLKSDYSSYRPAEAQKIENMFSAERNGTIVIVVSADSTKAEMVYMEYLKK